jgi:hypothetical protein
MAVLFNRRETPATKVQDWTRRGLLALGMENYGANKLAHKVTNGLLALTPLGAAEEVTQGARGITDANRRGEIAPVMSMQNALGVPAIFLGGKAKGADLAKMKLAAQMKKAGASRDDIWKRTGWFQGVDKKWRFEVDDSGASSDISGALSEIYDTKLTKPGMRGPLNQWIDHPALYAADPPAGQTTLAFLSPEKMGDAPGGYAPKFDAIALAANRSGDDALEIVLHEAQHGAQHRHNLARGGSRDQMAGEWARAKKDWDFFSNADTLAKEATASFGGNVDAAAKALNELGFEITSEHVDYLMRSGASTASKKAEAAHSALLQYKRGPGGFGGIGDPGKDLYHRLAGEVEARNVEKRLPMSAAERLATPPWATQDVADVDQIVRRR